MDREGAQGWLVAEPSALLCLQHVSTTRSGCQQLSLTETELRGGCTGKQPLNTACVCSAITELEGPCCPEPKSKEMGNCSSIVSKQIAQKLVHC